MGIFGSPGMGEMIIIGVIALLLFGKRLPEVAKNVGKTVSEFRKQITSIQTDIDGASRDTYKSQSYSSSSRPQPTADPEEFEVQAPKFEPPTSAPVPVAENSSEDEQPNA
ncbi:Sec-independent protein translocase subunit TatA/TatB [Calycomorphotria hydatis]|uniref:Sec-independent translocase n=1 Tax=Calycomorphotria hydatis TaxID=2528027 RepID=A0A517TA90_9PLAN|nr:twin-arginine translocase TatA/TatE family subunit [Calycomorphotria hydatis]QDT65287.1 sec-independent translocase [Calycomorphotria hydatis]